MTVDVGTEISINAGLQFANADAAAAGEKAAHDALAMARQHLSEFRREAGKPLLEPQTPSPAPLKELPEALASFGALAAFGMYDEYLEKIPITREGRKPCGESEASGPLPPPPCRSRRLRAGRCLPGFRDATSSRWKEPYQPSAFNLRHRPKRCRRSLSTKPRPRNRFRQNPIDRESTIQNQITRSDMLLIPTKLPFDFRC